ncbi:DUF3558 family protein [Gordonia otitidis]|uniref:DUF3558 family protein n=1 Tax=Gordonia otitidis TaxID=249058 RepID=UPI000A038959
MPPTKTPRRPFSRSHVRFRNCLILTLLLATAATCGCQTSGSPKAELTAENLLVSTEVSSSIRQTDAGGRTLPFTTKFPRRWNSGNDGTPYEPCTAATTGILRDTGLEPNSVEDAAAADFQTARGCRWRFVDTRLASLSQTVGNSADLDAYKRRHSSSVSWHDDLAVSGRIVAVSTEPDQRVCDTYVQTGSAIVVTTTHFSYKPPPISEICDKAIAFTRATIDQMPE